MSKRISGFHSISIKIPVSHVNAFPVIFFIRIAIQITVVHGSWNIFVIFRPGIARLSGRRCLPTDQIRKSTASHHSLLRIIDHGINSRDLLQKAHIKYGSHIDHNDHFPVTSSAHGQPRLFLIRKPVSFFTKAPVCAFSRLPCDHINTGVCIRIFHILFRNRLAGGILIRAAYKIDHVQLPWFQKLTLELCRIFLFTFLVTFCVLFDPSPGRYRKPGLFHSL